jgi:hypothetical protein
MTGVRAYSPTPTSTRSRAAMNDRSRRVPPPPPPPKPSRPTSPLPPLRRRRLDLTKLVSRDDQQRRPVNLPDPPPDGPVDFDRFGARPARLPEPPKDFHELLRDLKSKSTPPVSPTERLGDPAKTSPLVARPTPEDSARRLNVPIICTQTDRAFVLVFREKRSVFGTRFKLEATLANVGENGAEPSPSLTVPISSLDWGGVTCPHCRNRSRVRPIFCGVCNRLACDGRVTESGDDLFFKCADSCGTSGWVRSSLKTVTGTDGGRSAPQTAAGSFICAPEIPSGIPPKLPKPR